MSPRAEWSRKRGVFGSLLLLTVFYSIPANATLTKTSPQGPRLEVLYSHGSIAASETTVVGWDFGYVTAGGFLDLINSRSMSVSFAITLENLPGTTALPSSGTIPPFTVQSVLIFTDRTNVPIGEYTGKIRVIFVADTIFGAAFSPPADSVLSPGMVVNFGQRVIFTLWSKNTAAVNWHVKNQDGVRISRNFNATLTSKGSWEWEPGDTVTIPNGTPTVTSLSSMTPTGNPLTDDFFSVVYQTSGGPPATTRGDLNNDGFLTPADIVLELNLVFLNQIPPAGSAEGDVNCDGQLTPADVVLLLNKVFLDSGTLCT
jgi:hypothetical protein